MSVAEIGEALASHPRVDSIHDLHVWEVGSGFAVALGARARAARRGLSRDPTRTRAAARRTLRLRAHDAPGRPRPTTAACSHSGVCGRSARRRALRPSPVARGSMPAANRYRAVANEAVRFAAPLQNFDKSVTRHPFPGLFRTRPVTSPRYVRAAGVTEHEHVTPHTLRTSCLRAPPRQTGVGSGRSRFIRSRTATSPTTCASRRATRSRRSSPQMRG